MKRKPVAFQTPAAAAVSCQGLSAKVRRVSSGFKTARGETVSVSKESVSRANVVLGGGCERESEGRGEGDVSSVYTPMITSSVNSFCDKSVISKFTNGKGSSVLISEKSLNRAQSLLWNHEDETERKLSKGAALTSTYTPVAASSHLVSSDNNSVMSKFTTGKGSSVLISKKSLNRAKSLFQDGDIVDTDTSTAKKAALNPSLSSHPTEKPIVSKFTTGMGSSVIISEASINRAQSFLDSEKGAFDTTTNPDPNRRVSFEVERCNGDGAMKQFDAMTSTMNTPMVKQTTSNPSGLSDAKRIKSKFTTGKGTSVLLSEKALNRAESLLRDGDDIDLDMCSAATHGRRISFGGMDRGNIATPCDGVTSASKTVLNPSLKFNPTEKPVACIGRAQSLYSEKGTNNDTTANYEPHRGVSFGDERCNGATKQFDAMTSTMNTPMVKQTTSNPSGLSDAERIKSKFTTGKGTSVLLSEKALNRAESLLRDGDSIALLDMSGAATHGRRISFVGMERGITATPCDGVTAASKTVLNPSLKFNPTDKAVASKFRTGMGSSVLISEASINRAQSFLVSDCDKSSNFDFTTESDPHRRVSFGDERCNGDGAMKQFDAMTSTMNTPMVKQTTSNPSGLSDAERIKSKFTTGKGTSVLLSEKALNRAESLLRDGDSIALLDVSGAATQGRRISFGGDGYTTTANAPVKNPLLSSLSRSAEPKLALSKFAMGSVPQDTAPNDSTSDDRVVMKGQKENMFIAGDREKEIEVTPKSANNYDLIKSRNVTSSKRLSKALGSILSGKQKKTPTFSYSLSQLSQSSVDLSQPNVNRNMLLCDIPPQHRNSYAPDEGAKNSSAAVASEKPLNDQMAEGLLCANDPPQKDKKVTLCINEEHSVNSASSRIEIQGEKPLCRDFAHLLPVVRVDYDSLFYDDDTTDILLPTVNSLYAEQCMKRRLSLLHQLNCGNVLNVDINVFESINDVENASLPSTCFQQRNGKSELLFAVLKIISPTTLSSHMTEWVTMQLCWILWTFASYERTNTEKYLGKLLTWKNIVMAIENRFKQYTGFNPYDKGKRKSLLNHDIKMKFKDTRGTGSMSPLQRCVDIHHLVHPMVLCVAMTQCQTSTVESHVRSAILLTDGWWWVQAKVDEDIYSRLVETQRLAEGDKIVVFAATFEDGDDVLSLGGVEMSGPAGRSVMKLCYNAVRKAKCDAKVGFLPPFHLCRGLSVSSILPTGGAIFSLKVIPHYVTQLMVKVFVSKIDASAANGCKSNVYFFSVKEFDKFEKAFGHLSAENDEEVNMDEILEDYEEVSLPYLIINELKCDDWLKDALLSIEKDGGGCVEFAGEDDQEKLFNAMNKVKCMQQDRISSIVAKERSRSGGQVGLNKDIRVRVSCYMDVLARCVHSPEPNDFVWIRCPCGNDVNQAPSAACHFSEQLPTGETVMLSHLRPLFSGGGEGIDIKKRVKIVELTNSSVIKTSRQHRKFAHDYHGFLQLPSFRTNLYDLRMSREVKYPIFDQLVEFIVVDICPVLDSTSEDCPGKIAYDAVQPAHFEIHGLSKEFVTVILKWPLTSAMARSYCKANQHAKCGRNDGIYNFSFVANELCIGSVIRVKFGICVEFDEKHNILSMVRGEHTAVDVIQPGDQRLCPANSRVLLCKNYSVLEWECHGEWLSAPDIDLTILFDDERRRMSSLRRGNKYFRHANNSQESLVVTSVGAVSENGGSAMVRGVAQCEACCRNLMVSVLVQPMDEVHDVSPGDERKTFACKVVSRDGGTIVADMHTSLVYNKSGTIVSEWLNRELDVVVADWIYIDNDGCTMTRPTIIFIRKRVLVNM